MTEWQKQQVPRTCEATDEGLHIGYFAFDHLGGALRRWCIEVMVIVSMVC